MSDQMRTLSGTAPGVGPINGTYRYNAENKRVRAVVNGRRSFYVYDHTGKLTYSHKENDGEGVTPLRLQNGMSIGRWTGTQLTYVHTNHLGTPIRGTAGQSFLSGEHHSPGEQVFQDFYTPFGLNPATGWHGNIASGFLGRHPGTGTPTGNGFGKGSNAGVTGFTDHPKDWETGFTYMQARHYDPVAGRFLSVDSMDFMDSGHPGMFNRYSYSFNDPMNLFDPDGMTPESVMDRRYVYPRLSSEQQAGLDAVHLEVSENLVKANLAGASMIPIGRGAQVGTGVVKGALAKGAAKRAAKRRLGNVLGKIKDRTGATAPDISDAAGLGSGPLKEVLDNHADAARPFEIMDMAAKISA